MSKTKKPKKHYPTENVRLLKCGAWGYIHEGKAIYRTHNVELANEFSMWANQQIFNGNDYQNIRDFNEIESKAFALQRLHGEPKILPQCHLSDAATWRVEGNNYEAKTKIPNH